MQYLHSLAYTPWADRPGQAALSLHVKPMQMIVIL